MPDPPRGIHRARDGGPVYRVKEIFYTLQGEGTHTGRPAVFCRFTSCNLWTGREKDRHRAACRFCDTDFTGTDGADGVAVRGRTGNIGQGVVAREREVRRTIAAELAPPDDCPDCDHPGGWSWRQDREGRRERDGSRDRMNQ